MTAAELQAAALTMALDLVARHEGCHLHAYPDPLSPLGKALGARGIDHCGRTGEIPAHLLRLDGAPWTIGYGATGPDVVRGAAWSQQHARARLQEDLRRFYDLAERTWPGTKQLRAPAQAALISLVYNRGGRLERDPRDQLDRRREMRDLVALVAMRDYAGMANAIRGMKRLWAGQGVAGLLRRRDEEAALCDRAARETTAAGGVIA